MQTTSRRPNRSGIFARGDIVANRFEVCDVLGRGGMGVVYAVFDRVAELPRALKTFHTVHLSHASARRIFLDEMQTLLNLGEHPCIVGVRWMEEYDAVPFIVTDLIAPDASGRVTLSDHIRSARGPMPLEQTLNWGIQFCHAMEFCLAHGIKAHLDVKPDNVLVEQATLVKVADFGIAHAIRTVWRTSDAREPQPYAADEDRSQAARGSGTLGYMSPEVYRGEPGDQRADVYAFGQMVWQMGTGTPGSPFIDPTGRIDPAPIHRRQLAEELPPQTATLDPALLPIVTRCLRAPPEARYADFTHLRAVLEECLEVHTGQRITIRIPEIVPELYWVDKGASLHAVGRDEEALVCYDRAMRDGPLLEALIDKAVSLLALDRAAEALDCCERAVALDASSAMAWDAKGACQHSLGDRESAAEHHQRAIDCDPGYAPAWANLANVRLEHGAARDALEAIRQALTLDPNLVIAMGTEARILARLGQLDAALSSYERALVLQPYNAVLWADRAEVLRRKSHLRDAMASVARALTLEPANAGIHIIQGNCFRDMGRNVDALDCFDRALAADPAFPPALFSKASVLDELGEAATATALWVQYIDAAEADPLFRGSDYLNHARKRVTR